MLYGPKKKGFLLIEVMVSLMLITIIISYGLLSINYLHRPLVKADIEKLYATCLYLQQIAMTTNQKQVITFDVMHHCYYFQGHKEKLSPYTLFATLNNIKGPPSEPAKIINKPITFIGNQITFNPTGILQPGTIYLTDKKRQHQFALTIPVSKVSFLRKYSFQGGWIYMP